MTATLKQRQRYSVSIDDYVGYRRDGFLVVKSLLSPEDTNRLRDWTDDIYQGRSTIEGLLAPVFDWMTDKEKTERLSSARLHMPHRHDATAEWGFLHPRVLDVLEALIGPDVLALQTMMFFNPPGKGGQGWHQDSFYIQTQPDTLIGVWVALDRADEENGCLWVAPGSNHEPIYPPQYRAHFVHTDERHIDGLFNAVNESNMDDSVNNLSAVAAKYGEAVPVIMEPGDVLFFHAHLLHRSFRNESEDRFRRSFVSHYCNARSWVPWNHGEPYEGEAANNLHILARGRTHLPYASPKFGTPVELSPAGGEGTDNGAVMVAMPSGDMGKMEM